jgi:hypothetical protein
MSTKQNIKLGFRTISTWPLNSKTMDNKIRPSKVYIVMNLNNARNEEEYTIENEAENNPQWGEESIVAQNFH